MPRFDPEREVGAQIAPETCAMPLVMTVISSERVSFGRNGRMVSGASVCPMKMLAATFSDSAPLAPMKRIITLRQLPDDELHHAVVIEDAKNAAMKMMMGRTWNAKTTPNFDIFAPNSPKTNCEPAKE